MILYRLLRGVFHLLYNQFAWSYDGVAAAVSAGEWENWVRGMALRLAGKSRVLEIGHGPGHLLLALQEAGVRAVGVDLSQAMGRMARRKLHESGVPARLARADARSLPFPAGAFDAVVLTFPADYITEPEPWIAFRRVLRPGGVVLVLLGALPRGAHPLRLLSRVLFRITGQGRVQDLQQVRTQFQAFFPTIGLAGDLHMEVVNGSELFIISARRTESCEEPAV